MQLDMSDRPFIQFEAEGRFSLKMLLEKLESGRGRNPISDQKANDLLDVSPVHGILWNRSSSRDE